MTEKAATRVNLDRCRRCGKPAEKDGLCGRCHGTLERIDEQESA